MNSSKASKISEGRSRLKFSSGVQIITICNDNRVVINVCLYLFVVLHNREGGVHNVHLSICEGLKESH